MSLNKEIYQQEINRLVEEQQRFNLDLGAYDVAFMLAILQDVKRSTNATVEIAAAAERIGRVFQSGLVQVSAILESVLEPGWQVHGEGFTPIQPKQTDE